MKNSEERRIQNQFGAFCTRVLKNEALRIEAEYSRTSDREKPFNDLSENEIAQLNSNDKYFENSHVFEIHGLPVVVVGDLLAKALSELSKEKQEIILLSYFLDLSDREIGENSERATHNSGKGGICVARRIALVPVPTIMAAISGNEQALAEVVAYYQGYIRALSTRPTKDQYGNEYYLVDEDMRLRLEVKLIRSVMTGFQILPS